MGFLLPPVRERKTEALTKKAENLQQEKAMTAFPFIIQSLTLKQRISV